MKHFIPAILILICVTCLANLYIYTQHANLNWCEAEVDILRLSLDRLIQVHGIDLSE